jgi:hypothetical protein
VSDGDGGDGKGYDGGCGHEGLSPTIHTLTLEPCTLGDGLNVGGQRTELVLR